MTFGFAKQMTLAGMAALLMGGSALADTLTLTGEIFYFERIALPDNAIATVQLVDVSRADAPAEILSRQEISPAGQVPISFTLPFESVDIVEGHRYAVEGRIEVDGRLLFINDTHIGVDPLTQADPLRIRLVAPAVAEEGAAETGSDALIGTHWLLTELNGEPSAAGVETTLGFRADGMGGTGGCNTYGGTASFEGEAGLAFSQIFSTMMACAEPMMEQEQAYFHTLDGVVSYVVDGETLTLRDAEGTALVVFAAIPEA